MDATFKPSKFWEICPVCKGKGILPAIHTFASHPGNPDYNTGEVVVDALHSYCTICRGCGIVWESSLKR